MSPVYINPVFGIYHNLKDKKKIIKFKLPVGRKLMQIESFENILLLAANIVLKSIIERLDVGCEQDGSLFLIK